MPLNITWTLNVQVSGGPNLANSEKIDIDAYDRVTVTLDSTASKTLEVQPGGAGKVNFLLVRSSKYGDNLTFKVNAAGNPAHKLTGPLVLVGADGVALLDEPPNTLIITNNLPQPAAVIEILVGRKAVS